MIKEYKGSRFYPCPHAYSGEWCGGIAALISDHYECQRCGATWTLQGEAA